MARKMKRQAEIRKAKQKHKEWRLSQRAKWE